MRVGATGCIVIKHDKRPQPGSTPAEVVLDVDVSLRHADITLSADDCTSLCALSSAYLTRVKQPVAVVTEETPAVGHAPTKPLFREDFWYFEGFPAAGENNSSELNFDTLSGLLGKVSPSNDVCARHEE